MHMWCTISWSFHLLTPFLSLFFPFSDRKMKNQLILMLKLFNLLCGIPGHNHLKIQKDPIRRTVFGQKRAKFWQFKVQKRAARQTSYPRGLPLFSTTSQSYNWTNRDSHNFVPPLTNFLSFSIFPFLPPASRKLEISLNINATTRICGRSYPW